jgi:hypothetical protein
MKYKTRTDAIRIRQVTQAELIADGQLVADPEFHVTVSPAASGWWTRGELTGFRDRLNDLLTERVMFQRFYAGDPAEERPVCAEDAAYRRGYLEKPVEDSTRPETRAAIAAMLSDRSAGRLAGEIPARCPELRS